MNADREIRDIIDAKPKLIDRLKVAWSQLAAALICQPFKMVTAGADKLLYKSSENCFRKGWAVQIFLRVYSIDHFRDEIILRERRLFEEQTILDAIHLGT